MLIAPAFGADWVEYRSGPFHVFSDAGDKHGREALTQLEQLRFVLGQMFGGASGATLGTSELTTVWPIYLVLFDNEKEYAPHVLPKTLTDGAAETLAAWTADAGLEKGKDFVLPHDLMRAVTLRLIEDNPGRLLDEIENGLADLFCTLQVASGTRVTLGAPLAQGELTGDRLREWAKLQMLATQPDFAGKLRVYVNNLAQAGEEDAAVRNAYGIPAAQLNERAAAYFAAGKFEPVLVNSRPIDPKRDFIEADVPKDEQVVAKAAAKASAEQAAEDKKAAERRVADKKAMEKRAQKRAASDAEAAPKYTINGVPLSDPKSDSAKSDAPSQPEPAQPAAETPAPSKPPQTPKEAAAPAPVVTVDSLIAELDAQGKTFPPGTPRALLAENTPASLDQAAKSNPTWAEPYVKMAALETNPAKMIDDLKKAAALAPRNPDYWQTLATTQTAANQFADAEKSWTAAERAAPNVTERARIHQAKLDLEDQRAAFELAERQRQRDEEARELQRIKDSAAAEVHAAEQAANARLGANAGSVANPVPFAEAGFGDPGGTPVSGSLTRVDCLAGGSLRLTILQATGRPVQLLIRDLKKLMVASDSGQAEFACGVQKPAKKIEVRHDSKADAKFGTLGDIAVVKFP